MTQASKKTYAAIREVIRSLGPRDIDWHDGAAVADAIVRASLTEDLAEAIAALGITLPLCACRCCHCTEDASQVEPDGGELMCGACCEYATDEDGEVVCSRDERYEDAGEWTGGGSQGCGTAWVSRPRVRS